MVARDPRIDLALVELDRVPAAAVGLPFAAKPGATGATVYSVGASGVDLRTFSGAALAAVHRGPSAAGTRTC